METLFLALRVLVALGAILALIWFVQRKVTGAGGKSAGGKKSAVAGRFGASKMSIQVLGTHRLGAKASITVVEIDGVKMVLGVTEHGITVLENTVDNTSQPPVVAPAITTIAHPEAVAPESDPTQVAASAVDIRATADASLEPEPVDFAAVFREALDEAADAPALATVVDAREQEHVAPRRRRRRVTIPALAEQLLPHMTRTLAAAIGIRVETAPSVPDPVTPASARSVPPPLTSATGALAAFRANSEPGVKKPKDYATASPLSAHLPVLQRVS
jgi:flagellar protein FliO/FliZ